MSSDFADLARNRHDLQEFCRYHVPSLGRFRSDPSFKLHIHDSLGPELRHLTTTNTCIESLLDCSPLNRPDYAEGLAKIFAINAMNREWDKWTSEKSAAIYCRCRALPVVVRYLEKYDPRLAGHIQLILAQLNETDRFGLGEADENRSSDYWYPPNAFHTYWFFRICEEIRNRFHKQYQKLNRRFHLQRKQDEMLLWARSIAGRQISLHAAESSSLDSDQLAWSLTILMRFDRDIQSNLANQDFLREGLKSLFSKQTGGTWHHGRPLFHYALSGSAYCYVYETFTALLKTVLERQEQGEFLRAALRPYCKNLIDLWHYARETQIQLLPKGQSSNMNDIGWSSGHRIDDSHPEPEGWATASVFSYAQALRRLLGVWTRDEAISGLNRVSAFVTAEASKKIIERGDTWPHSGGPSAAEQLMTLFVNPTIISEESERFEPDNQPIRKTQARSAILFGPPGTSKTTLVRAVAGEIGWEYIELHASHFVAGGLPHVQRTADELFSRLMEIDHAVVLFDEIDELVRAREVEKDAFGRFLTTSMLPKLAELWDQRKVIYFVATNHIEYFDRAVTRAQRFDVLIFVTPPSFSRKIERTRQLISTNEGKKVKIDLSLKAVSTALSKIDCSVLSANPDVTDSQKELLPDSSVLAKFILLRWDQLDEFAHRLGSLRNSSSPVENVSEEMCGKALALIEDHNLQLLKTYCNYRLSGDYVINNYSKETVWHVENLPASSTYSEPLISSNGKVWLRTLESPVDLITNGFRFVKSTPGCLHATPVRLPRHRATAKNGRQWKR